MIISAVDLGKRRNPLGCQALAARKWFEVNSPPDTPPLPLGYDEREDLKVGGINHLVAWYACSLACRDYDVLVHPSFDDYACGLMASEYTSGFIKNDQELQKRFPPRTLSGLGPALVWEPPAIHAKTMASWHRSRAWSCAAA
jgi:hypothetical protein